MGIENHERSGSSSQNLRSSQYSEDESLGGLLRDLRQDSTSFIEQHLSLFKAEMDQKISNVGTSSVKLLAGAMILTTGLYLLLFAVAQAINVIAVEYGFSNGREWLGFVVVGSVCSLVGYLVFASGKKGVSKSGLSPDESLDELQQDKEWLKNNRS